eukprot:CAMPEP_0202961832 /NCGR_PEP_ID=MMETSP1396-20130829/5917_1 /ASSEMBLY_ACC=CAM_ASM_000872 /TAXON_ID= /ORGANISM="Pseudokeronopsis sp., Strain Brazil" /LENGTH=205 /DNA_ID=CAMNT_0049681963 /DNA_START=102 /DNA_END=717 /DNA_ORIENTATION=-
MPYQGKTMVLMNKFQNGTEEDQREGSCKSVLHKHKFGTLHSRAYAEVHQISLDMQESKQFDFGGGDGWDVFEQDGAAGEDSEGRRQQILLDTSSSNNSPVLWMLKKQRHGSHQSANFGLQPQHSTSVGTSVQYGGGASVKVFSSNEEEAYADSQVQKGTKGCMKQRIQKSPSKKNMGTSILQRERLALTWESKEWFIPLGLAHKL